jgi:hypothetical protein
MSEIASRLKYSCKAIANSGSEITPRAAKFIGANFCFVIAAALGFGLVRSVIFWNMALAGMGLLLIALLV